MSKSELSLITGISDVSSGTITIDGNSTNGTLNVDNGTAGITANTIYTTSWYPSYYTYPVQNAELEIRQVSNGFVLRKYGTEYVFANVKDMLSWIEKNYKEKKK